MNGGYTYYKIKSGDTLKGIAKAHGISEFALSKMNNGVNSASLKTGGFLLIYTGSDTSKQDTSNKEDDQKTGDKTSGKTSDKKTPVEKQYLDEKEIMDMARAKVGGYGDRLEELAQSKDNSLRKINENRAKTTLSYDDAVRALEKDLVEDSDDYEQDAIKQGLARSSIIGSVQEKLKEEADAEIALEERDRKLAMQSLENSALDVEQQYKDSASSLKSSYEKALAKAAEQLRKANQAANDKIDEYNGVTVTGAGKNNLDMTERLLDTLSKKQAKAYLERNQEELSSVWGKTDYDKVFSKYK